jgi:hypothetical protein
VDQQLVVERLFVRPLVVGQPVVSHSRAR